MTVSRDAVFELLCIGNELLTGLIENSNSSYLTQKLQSAGIQVGEMAIVADSQEVFVGARVDHPLIKAKSMGIGLPKASRK